MGFGLCVVTSIDKAIPLFDRTIFSLKGGETGGKTCSKGPGSESKPWPFAAGGLKPPDMWRRRYHVS
ncbi:Hypothetical protein SMAX5B_011275 [Scophthalmus maximus]|uniref:Uncharacterized protein n=1 Tax=Scophthalmus maximus TaxID=52904 RepID=A0A2U9BHG8_SCOMX|nr:Hypothetical protein SMAX5B_011275 [Scophthalmus maximus]